MLFRSDELHDKSINKVFIAEATFFKDDHLQLINYKISTQEQDNYSPWNSLSPRWWFPSFEFSEQRAQWGLTTAGADALGIHHYFLTASYDTRLDEPAVSLGYGYTDRLFLSWARINDIFLDSTGGINQITRRDVASLTWAFHNRRIQKQWSLLFGITYRSEERRVGKECLGRCNFRRCP